MKNEAKIEKALRGSALSLTCGAYVRYGWHNVIGPARYGWARYSAAGECVYLGRSAAEIYAAAEDELAVASARYRDRERDGLEPWLGHAE